MSSTEIIYPVEQKLVPFNGNELLGVRASDGKVYVGARWVCDGIGLREGQRNNQLTKIQTDLVLKRGVRKFILPTNSGEQEVTVIELNFLPLWVAKISPNTVEGEVQECLIEYQLKAKDVLAAAFVPQEKPPMTQSELVAYLAQQNVERERAEAEQNKRIAAVEKKVEDTAEILALNPTEWRRKTSNLLNKIAQARGGTNESFQDVRNESYDLLEQRASCRLNTQLINRKRKMALEGAAKSKIDKVSKLDCIADNARLTEIYLAIVKEMAIKYSINLEE